MGYIRHNAIIATAWQAQAVAGLVEYARKIGAEALVGGERTNGYATVCITPDGSKEGWQTSAEGDERRSNIKLWMREHPDFYYEWCEVAYGSDDGKAEITDSGWVTANAVSAGGEWEHAGRIAELERDAERMLGSLRVAVIALAHASESNKVYSSSYEHVSNTIAEVAIRYDHGANAALNGPQPTE